MSYTERRRFLWILFIMGLALAALVANATTLVPLSFNELAQQSVAVARLRCLNSETLWDRGEIWTDTHFEVVERHKGALQNTVTVRTLGGRSGNFHSHVDGVPAFRTGEEVYLFLWGKSGEPYRVLGWSQGTFRIARSPQSGEEKITQESTVNAVDARGHAMHSAGIRQMPVSTFQEKLRQALADPAR